MPEVAEISQEIGKKKAVDVDSLNASQRAVLRSGLQDAMQQSRQFSVLGAEQKVMYYSTLSMITNDKSITMLDLVGEDYWGKVAIPGTLKKEPQRYLKFTFNYHIPGTNSSIQAEREWKFEDFQ